MNPLNLINSGGSPLRRRPAEAVADRGQPAVQLQPGGGQGRPTVVRQGAADGRAVPADDLGRRVGPALDGPLDRADLADFLLEHLLGVPVGLEHRGGRLPQVVELATAGTAPPGASSPPPTGSSAGRRTPPRRPAPAGRPGPASTARPGRRAGPTAGSSPAAPRRTGSRGSPTEPRARRRIVTRR